jgi:hypothetical protein
MRIVRAARTGKRPRRKRRLTSGSLTKKRNESDRSAMTTVARTTSIASDAIDHRARSR